MLAQLEKPTHDFFVLARYLVQGDAQPTPPERVAWIFTRNLAIDDPKIAAKIMTATAALSKRCTHACLHTIIAWHPDERPTPEDMQSIARETLQRAGLAEHQAFVVGHGDKAHSHLHMMINRIHPETGRAWSDAHSHRRFGRIMRELAEEYGFRHVPAHSFNPELTDERPKEPGSAATYAARQGANTSRTQWSRRQARTFTARINEKLDPASTWDDLHVLFAAEGVELEAKGKGHVVGNATSYVKLSALGLQPTAKNLIKRRSPARPPPSRRTHATRPLIDAVDLARAFRALGLADAADVRAAIQQANAPRNAKLAKASLIEQLLASLRQDLAAWTAHTPPQRSSPRKLRPRAQRHERRALARPR